MKKRYLAFILTGAMMFGMAYPVSAEAADSEQAEAQTSNEISWDDVSAAVEEAGWEGDFVTFDEIAIKMFVPDVLQPQELTDEDKEQGYIQYFSTEDETAAVSVMYVDTDGMDLEEYQTYLENESDVSEVEPGVINEIPVLTYTMPETNTACISISTQAGYILEFAFSPMNDEGFASVAQIMMASIQEETAEAE